jgi:hypothetical protein
MLDHFPNPVGTIWDGQDCEKTGLQGTRAWPLEPDIIRGFNRTGLERQPAALLPIGRMPGTYMTRSSHGLTRAVFSFSRARDGLQWRKAETGGTV